MYPSTILKPVGFYPVIGLWLVDESAECWILLIVFSNFKMAAAVKLFEGLNCQNKSYSHVDMKFKRMETFFWLWDVTVLFPASFVMFCHYSQGSFYAFSIAPPSSI